MIEVYIDEINSIINSLNALIDEYEEIKLNLFYQLQDSCTNNWQDSMSITFDNKIYREKQEADLIIEDLNNKKNLYRLIYDKYNSIGKKIIVNLNSKEKIINMINNIYNQIVNIINDFNNIDVSFYYSERTNIVTQKNKMINIRNNMQEIKSNILQTYNKIEEIEREIKAKINNLEQLKINEFDLNG